MELLEVSGNGATERWLRNKKGDQKKKKNKNQVSMEHFSNKVGKNKKQSTLGDKTERS